MEDDLKKTENKKNGRRPKNKIKNEDNKKQKN